MQRRTAFDVTWLVVGVAALVGYVAIPASLVEGEDPEHLWFEALWLVPAMVVAAGLVAHTAVLLLKRAPHLLAPTLILLGVLLLVPNTLLYLGLGGFDPATLPMLTCHLTLVGVAVAGLVVTISPARGRAAWVVLVATPLLLAALTVAGMALAWSPEEGAAIEDFPHPESIVLGEPSRAFMGGWSIEGTFETPLAETVQAEIAVLEAEGWTVAAEGWGMENGVMSETPSALVATKPGWRAELGFEDFEGPGHVMVHLWSD